MTTLTKEQKNFAKEELLSIVWTDLEANWKDYLILISENLSEEFDLETDEVREELREKLDILQGKSYGEHQLPLIATCN